MNLWGAILSGAAFGVSLATLAAVVVVLRRPVHVKVIQARPRPRHSDRLDRQPGRAANVVADDSGGLAPWPSADSSWPGHGDEIPDDPPDPAEFARPRPYLENPYPAPVPPPPPAEYSHEYGVPYPAGPTMLRTYATPNLGNVAPGANGTWIPSPAGPVTLPDDPPTSFSIARDQGTYPAGPSA